MMEPETDRELRIYSNTTQIPTKHFSAPEFAIKDTLTSKDAVKFLLDGTLRLRVCKYCLKITQNLNELDEIIVVAGKYGLYEVTIKDIVASFYPVKVSCDTNFPNKICKDCLDRAFQCYLFTQQCEQAVRALHNFFEDLNEKFNKLDPMEPLKKRGKPKLYLNHNILNVEFKNVIDYAEPLINLINLNALPNDSKMIDLECPKCWQVLPNVTSLVNHEKSHPKTMWFYCKQCGKAFVKYTQLKKHKRQEHSEKIGEIKSEKVIFTCKQCGVSNDLLSKHLLHIEKHSFTKTLGDLIMNPKGNCAICFKKACNMVNLHETMHMHGGGAGLTGEKSISNIVSAVFPDKSYKSRDLLIPTYPSILHIMKHNIENSESPIKKMRVTLENSLELENINTESVKKFLFCKPEIVRMFTNTSNEIREFLDENIKIINANVANNAVAKYENNYLLTQKSVKESTFKSNQELIKIRHGLTRNALKLVKQTAAKISKDESVKDVTYVTNIFQSYVEPNSIENYALKVSENFSANVGENNYKTCTICWLFKKPTCLSCKQNMKTHEFKNLNEEREPQKKSCTSCYLFSKVGFCDVCHNILQVEKDSNKIYVLTEDKIDKTIFTVWQCNICLSNNINRETCICCEENRNLNKNVLNSRHIFTATLRDTFTYEMRKEDYIFPPVKDVEVTSIISKSNKTLKKLNNIDLHSDKNLSTDSPTESPMDVEMSQPICEEVMDFEESKLKEELQDAPMGRENTNMNGLHEQAKSSHNILAQIQTGIKFNIGIGNIDRKFKNPRKISSLRK